MSVPKPVTTADDRYLTDRAAALGSEAGKARAPVVPPSPGNGLVSRSMSDDGTTVEGRFSRIVRSDNPLVRNARTRALQRLNSRGLINSSLAIGEADLAAARTALPIAQQDASQAWQSKEGLLAREFQSQESQKDRDWKTGEGVVAREFQARERALDREHELRLQNERADIETRLRTADAETRMELLNRQAEIDREMNDIRQRWQSRESELGREHQLDLQSRDFDERGRQRNWQSMENSIARDWQSGENNLSREQQRWLQESQQKWQSRENVFSREHQLKIQANDFAGRERLMKVNNEWQSMEKSLDRDHAMQMRKMINDNAQLLATNNQAAQMTIGMMQYTSGIAQNPNIGPADRQKLINDGVAYYNRALKIIGVAGGDDGQGGGGDGGGDGGGGNGGGGPPPNPDDLNGNGIPDQFE